MPHPTEPLLRASSLAAPAGVDYIELRSTLQFLDADDKTAFLAHVGALGAAAIVTTVGTPGSDAAVPSEQAVREQVTILDAAIVGLGEDTSDALALKADLVGGKIPTAQLPAIALGEVFTAANQAAMLALTAQIGDVAIRSDQSGRRWILGAADATQLASWIQLETPDAVTSVNGQAGAVVLGKGDIGLGNADNTSDANKPVSTAQQTALNLKLNAANNLSDIANVGTAQTNLGLALGVNVQPYRLELTKLGAALTTVASATTTDIGAETGDAMNISGTTTIASLGTTNVARVERTLIFQGALTITHNATSMILPTGANIVTAAGDVAKFRHLGGGNWRCVSYMRADGTALAGGVGGSAFDETGTYFFDVNGDDATGDGTRNNPWETAAPLLTAILPLGANTSLSLDIASGTNIGDLGFGGVWAVTLNVRGRDQTSAIGTVTNAGVPVTINGSGAGTVTITEVDATTLAANSVGGAVTLREVTCVNVTSAGGDSDNTLSGGVGGPVILEGCVVTTITLTGGAGGSIYMSGSGGTATLDARSTYTTFSAVAGMDGGAGIGGTGSLIRRIITGDSDALTLPAAGTIARLEDKLSAFAVTSATEFFGVMNGFTGTGNAVRATSPTLVTPNLGTPSTVVLTNATGTATGLTSGSVTTNANLTGHVTSTGNAAVLGSFTLSQLNAAVSDADVAILAANTFTAAQTVSKSNSGTDAFAVSITATPASTSDGAALTVTMASGYNGAGYNRTIFANNLSAGTGTDLRLSTASASPYANAGGNMFALATTAGTNVGNFGMAQGGNKNFGLIGKSTIDKSNATNIGIAGFAAQTSGTPIRIGVFGGLMTSEPTYASAAGLFDNGSTTSDILVVRDNGTPCFTVADGGGVSITGTTTLGSGGTAISKILSATATVDLPEIGAGGDYTHSITVTGALISATPTAAIGFSAPLPTGLVIAHLYVADNLVEVTVANVTGAPIDPVSRTIRVTVIQN